MNTSRRELIATKEERVEYSKQKGKYYRDLSYDYHWFMVGVFQWPIKPKNPFHRTRSEAQIARQQRIRNEKWLANNPNIQKS